MNQTCPFLIRADQIEASDDSASHPWNPNSAMRGMHLSKQTGLTDTGISWVEVPPGKESCVYHLHYREDEWIYILSGSGTAEINDREYAVGPGDFMGFPAGKAAHHLRNTGSEPLRYLMGGSSKRFELADFPRLGRRVIRQDGEIGVVKLSDISDFEADSP